MIHERDFIAGRTIRANIMDGMEKSRRVIFILSRYNHIFCRFFSENKAWFTNIASVFLIYRNFLKSKWGMEEFMIADAEAVNGRKNFIVIVLKDKLKLDELPRELRTYMRTNTYIDGTKNIDKVVKRIR